MFGPEGALTTVANFLQVDAHALGDSICSSVTKVMGKDLKMVNNVRKAKNVRDAIARSIYDQLFLGLVGGCSQNLLPAPMMPHEGGAHVEAQAHLNDLCFMGVLDIFGFEFVEDDKLDPAKGIQNAPLGH